MTAAGHEITAAGDDFAEDVAAWFAAHTPRDWRRATDAMSAQEYAEFQRDWLRMLNTRGFGAPGVPEEWGGGGYSFREQVAIFDAWARSGAPPVDLFEVSLNHVPSTFLAAGTEEQKHRYVRAAIEGTVWCQGFSEPSAGSDLKALRTKAVRVEGGWRVTGQKTWSSHAAHAGHCLLLARTDQEAPARKGISYFVMDMDAPGVDVRPIAQIHGPEEFCELFLDDVFVPEQNLVGPENDGWQVAQSTLGAERGPIALPIIEQIGVAARKLMAEHVDAQGQQLGAVEERLTRLIARQTATRSLALDTIDLVERGRGSASIASLIKLSFSELLQETTDFASLLEPERTLLDTGSAHFLGYVSGRWMTDWLGSWAATIAGGANEVQRTIVAERLLDMPRESTVTRGAQ